MRMVWCVRGSEQCCWPTGEIQSYQLTLCKAILAPLRLCRRWQNPDRCVLLGEIPERGGPGFTSCLVGPCYPGGEWGPRRGGSGSQTADPTSLQTFS